MMSYVESHTKLYNSNAKSNKLHYHTGLNFTGNAIETKGPVQ